MRRKKIKKRLLTFLLTLCMTTSFMPATGVMAAGTSYTYQELWNGFGRIVLYPGDLITYSALTAYNDPPELIEIAYWDPLVMDANKQPLELLTEQVQISKTSGPQDLQLKALHSNSGITYDSWDILMFGKDNSNMLLWLSGHLGTSSITSSVKDTNGSISGLPADAKAGDTVYFNVSPKDGYEFDLAGTEKTPTTLNITEVTPNSRYKFTMPNEAVEIKGSFKKIKKYAINMTDGQVFDANGKPITEAAAGEHILITPLSTGWDTFDYWDADCALTLPTNTASNEFIMPNSAVNIKAVPKGTQATHQVTVQNDGNGTASANPATAKKGDKITLSATPNKGYQFKEWQVIKGGISIANNEFTMTDEDVTVKAIFEKIPAGAHKVTVENDGNGTGTATPANAVKGGKITLSANAKDGYQFKEWKVISGGVTINNNEFIMPDEDVTVKAFFEKKGDPSKPQPTTPTITAGKNAAYQIGSGKNLSLTFSKALDELAGVYVDGKAVDSSNYTMNANKTVITIKSSYLDTLSAGKHTIVIRSKDGTSLSTEITVKSKAASSTTNDNKTNNDNKTTNNSNTKTDSKKATAVQTGDSTNIVLFMGLLSMSVIAIFVSAYVTRRRCR